MDIRFYFPGFFADLAKWHEDGAGNLPQRRHLSLFLEENYSKIVNEVVSKTGDLVLRDQRKFLEKVGNLVISRYKDWMIAGNVRPLLKQETIDFKARNNSATPEIPLVFSGSMINSLLYGIE